ncbi:MAG: type II secretion system minor pseudopilin GspI [Hyphomonadaceae bacterium]
MRDDATLDQAGFSLLEVMVALAIFSLAALAVLNVLAQSQQAQARTELRTAAQILAENQVAEALAASRPPAIGETSGQEDVLSRPLNWIMTVSPTSEARILRIDVRVRERDGQQTLAEITSFGAAP